MLLRLLFCLSVLFSLSVSAGKITIEKSDSLIRNDLFDAKRERAQEYKVREEERKRSNEYWSSSIDPSCALLRNHYLIYRCANGFYYKGYERGNRKEYRELSNPELKKLLKRKD